MNLAPSWRMRGLWAVRTWRKLLLSVLEVPEFRLELFEAPDPPSPLM